MDHRPESGKTITGATAMVSLVTTAEAERAERAIAQAGADGARILTGGERDGTVVSPAVVADVDLRELAAAGDVLTPYAPLGEETRHLADEPLLARVKPAAVLVTCGRGGLLGPDADLAALESGRPAGVGLDVLDPEPALHHPLFDHPDVVLTPHLMGMTRRAMTLTFGDAAHGVADVPPRAAAGRGRRLRPEPQKGHSMTTTP